MLVIKRHPENPILTPDEEEFWQSRAVFNWSPVKDGRLTRVLYRAMSSENVLGGARLSISSIGYAESRDGLHFSGRRQFIYPEHDWERYGCEDPRVTKLNGRYYVFYTALGEYPFTAGGIRGALAVTRDFKKIDAKYLVTPFNCKAIALFPEPIGGRLTAIITADTDRPPAKMAVVSFEKESDIWSPAFWEKWYGRIGENEINPRRSSRDHIEVGAPPLKTKAGWLVIYSHIQNYFGGGAPVFGIEALLLDLKNPRRIIGATRHPLIVAAANYEKYGQVPNIVFPSGALIEGRRLKIFYGAADTVSAFAETNLDNLLRVLRPEAKPVVRRFAKNPILAPNVKHPWESRAVFNPGAVDVGGKIHLLYRALSENNTSVFGYAASRDGLNFRERNPVPVYEPKEEFEMKKNSGNSGAEDPRLTRIGNKLYMFYTAFDGGLHPPRVAVSAIAVKDFLKKKWNWQRPVLCTTDREDDKDAALFPEKIMGKYLIFHRVGNDICADFVKSLEFYGGLIDRATAVLSPRWGNWDGRKVGITAPPLKTKKGWLLFYHGFAEDGVYRVGAALLQRRDPRVVIDRTVLPIFEPEEAYEKEGLVPNVVFPCGIVNRRGTLYIYYGAADKVVGVATAKLADILKMFD